MTDEKTRVMKLEGLSSQDDASYEEITVSPSLEPGELEGKRIGRYAVGRLLGTGGGSHVYEAHDDTLQRKVALKVLFGQARNWTRKALKEARAQAKVDHEFICKVYDVGSFSGHAYIAMQYVHGVPLDEITETLSPHEKVELMRRILLAVDAAHRRGLIHRDLKPANILVERNAGGFWKPYVTDFGLARELKTSGVHSHSGRIQGTPAYMAPEQAKGESIRDTHSDIYSLSATFYKFLSGATPFRGNNPVAVMLKVVREEAKPLRDIDRSIPPDLSSIIHRGLAKSPEDRFDSAGEFARELTRFLERRPVESHSGGSVYAFTKLVQRNKATMCIAGVLLTLLIGLSATMIRERFRVQRQALYLERFMEQVQAINWQMRIVSMLPPHDTRKEHMRIRARMRTIETEMTQLGKLAEGPGYYALGKGYLALGEPQKALTYLDMAKDNTPWKAQVSYAWGEASCRIYYEKLRAVQRIRNPSVRTAAAKKLKKEILEPALKALRAGKQDEVKPHDYTEAQVAYFEGRTQDVWASLRKSLELNPWFYDALHLEAEVHMEQGRSLVNSGDRTEGRKAFEKAGPPMARAKRIAASDVDLYLTECERLTWLMEIDLAEGHNFMRSSQALLDEIEKGLVLDPENAQLLSMRAFAWYKQGEHLYYYSQEDPQQQLSNAMLAAQKTIEADPDFSWGYQYLGHAHGLLSEFKQENGKPGWSDLEQAQKAYHKALEVDSSNVSILSSLGVVSWQMADIALRTRRNPDPYLDMARERFNETLEMYPDYFQAQSNLGLVHWSAAETALVRGEDPSKHFELATQCFRDAIKLSKYDYAYANLAEINLLWARYVMDSGGNPKPLIRETEDACVSLLTVNDQYPHPYGISSHKSLTEARLAIKQGQNPRSHLEAALHILEGVKEEWSLFVEKARVHLLWGEWLFTSGKIEQAEEQVIIGTKYLEQSDDGDEATVLRGAFNSLTARIQGDRDAEILALKEAIPGFINAPALRFHYAEYYEPNLSAQGH